jgi:hypothetical protein
MHRCLVIDHQTGTKEHVTGNPCKKRIALCRQQPDGHCGTKRCNPSVSSAKPRQIGCDWRRCRYYTPTDKDMGGEKTKYPRRIDVITQQHAGEECKHLDGSHSWMTAPCSNHCSQQNPYPQSGGDVTDNPPQVPDEPVGRQMLWSRYGTDERNPVRLPRDPQSRCQHNEGCLPLQEKETARFAFHRQEKRLPAQAPPLQPRVAM